MCYLIITWSLHFSFVSGNFSWITLRIVFQFLYFGFLHWRHQVCLCLLLHLGLSSILFVFAIFFFLTFPLNVVWPFFVSFENFLSILSCVYFSMFLAVPVLSSASIGLCFSGVYFSFTSLTCQFTFNFFIFLAIPSSICSISFLKNLYSSFHEECFSWAYIQKIILCHD